MALRLLSQATFIARLADGAPHLFTAFDGLLPPVAIDRATPEFLERFRLCFEDLGRRLLDPRQGRERLTRCVGDEIALAHVLQLATDEAELGSEACPVARELELLPPVPERDAAFDHYDELLLGARRFELLWRCDASLFVGDREVPLSVELLDLRPDRWFLTAEV